MEIPPDAMCQLTIDNALKYRRERAEARAQGKPWPPRSSGFLRLVQPSATATAEPTPAELYPRAAGSFYAERAKWIRMPRRNVAVWRDYLTPERVGVPKCDSLPEHAFLLQAKNVREAMTETWGRVWNAFVVPIPAPLEFVCEHYGWTVTVVQNGEQFYACVSGADGAITKEQAEEVWGP